MIESLLTDCNHDKKVSTAVLAERHFFLTFSQKTKLQANVIGGSLNIFGPSLRAGEETNSRLYLCSKDVCPPGWSLYNRRFLLPYQ